MNVQPKFHPTAIRRIVVDMAYSGATVHVGCAFSIVELLCVLYDKHLQFDSGNPQWAMRDYMVLSKGHGVMAQYACLYQMGVLSPQDIEGYFKNGTRLKGLADVHVPGVEATSGSLGHGLSVAAGMALAAQKDESAQMAYCLVGDGEINEGTVWEAALFASHFKLDNLVVIVDVNGFQAMGTTDEVLSLGSIEAKFESFGFDVVTVDGHDLEQIDAAYTQVKTAKNGKPKAIVAKTTKGKGVSFMENDNVWHYTRLNSDTYARAMNELAMPA